MLKPVAQFVSSVAMSTMWFKACGWNSMWFQWKHTKSKNETSHRVSFLRHVLDFWHVRAFESGFKQLFFAESKGNSSASHQHRHILIWPQTPAPCCRKWCKNGGWVQTCFGSMPLTRCEPKPWTKGPNPKKWKIYPSYFWHQWTWIYMVCNLWFVWISAVDAIDGDSNPEKIKH